MYRFYLNNFSANNKLYFAIAFFFNVFCIAFYDYRVRSVMHVYVYLYTYTHTIPYVCI